MPHSGDFFFLSFFPTNHFSTHSKAFLSYNSSLFSVNFLQVDPGKYKGVFSGFGVTIKEDGIRGLGRGWAPTFFGYSAQGMFKFGLYEIFKVEYHHLIGDVSPINQSIDRRFNLSNQSINQSTDDWICQINQSINQMALEKFPQLWPFGVVFTFILVSL